MMQAIANYDAYTDCPYVWDQDGNAFTMKFPDLADLWEDYDEGPIEDEDGSLAYARMLERRAEAGTWWGGSADSGYSGY